jgi:anti-anti-sigma factor
MRGHDRFRCEVVPERERVMPVGDIDISTVDAVVRELERWWGAGFSRIAIDLSETAFMASSGLRLLFRWDGRVRAHRGELWVIAGTGQVHRLFEIVGLNKKLSFAAGTPSRLMTPLRLMSNSAAKNERVGEAG